MSTPEIRADALDLAVDLAAAHGVGHDLNQIADTVLAVARKFTGYIDGPPGGRTGLGVPVTITGPDMPPCNQGDVLVQNASGELDARPAPKPGPRPARIGEVG